MYFLKFRRRRNFACHCMHPAPPFSSAGVEATMRITQRTREWIRLAASAALGAAIMYAASPADHTASRDCDGAASSLRTQREKGDMPTGYAISLSRRPPTVRTRYYRPKDQPHVGYGGDSAREMFESRGWVVASAGRTSPWVRDVL
jgi:hypothetical protein